MSAKNKIYAVAKGRQTGLFSKWMSCFLSIEKYSGAKYKSFDTLEEAEKWLEDNLEEKSKQASHSSSHNIDDLPDLDEQSLSNLSRSNSKKRRRATEDKIEQKTRKKKCTVEQPKPSCDDGANIVYTDGSCLGNGKGHAKAGVGVYFADGDSRNVSEPLKGERQTNQRAEVTAGIRAMQLSDPNVPLEIRTDSTYLVNGMTEWIYGWNTEKKRSKISNIDLFDEAKSLKHDFRKAETRFVHVRAHSGIHGNEEADRLANEGANKNK